MDNIGASQDCGPSKSLGFLKSQIWDLSRICPKMLRQSHLYYIFAMNVPECRAQRAMRRCATTTTLVDPVEFFLKDVWCSQEPAHLIVFHAIHCGHPFLLLYGCSSMPLMAWSWKSATISQSDMETRPLYSRRSSLLQAQRSRTARSTRKGTGRTWSAGVQLSFGLCRCLKLAITKAFGFMGWFDAWKIAKLSCFGSMFEAKHLEEQQAHGAST